MSNVQLFLGPPSSGKTQAIVKELSKLKSFDYTFIGSQGEFVKFVAKIASKENGFVNRAAFKTVDQFAVEAVLKQKRMIFADKTLKLFILSSVIDKMASKNSHLPDVLVKQAKILRHKSTVEKLLSLIDDIKAYMKEDEFTNSHAKRELFISSVMKRFNDTLKAKNLFDTYDAYKMIAEGEIKIDGKYLFVDGFYDFTPIVSKLFKSLILNFENIFVTATRGEIFEKGTRTILKTVEGYHPKVKHFEFKGSELAKGLFFGNGKGLHMHVFEKKTDEVQWVCKKVKYLLLNGKKPEDIEIIIKSSNSDYLKALKEKYDEISIDSSYLGQKDLFQSVVVQQIMLPIKVVVNGYPPDLLLSMVTTGFVQEDSFSLIYDSAKLNRGRMELSHHSRLNDWNEKLDKFVDFLSKKRQFVMDSDDEYNKSATLEEIKKLDFLVKSAKKTVKTLFEFLSLFENAKSVSAYTKALEKVIEIFKNRPLNQDELYALQSFKELLWEVEGTLSFIGKGKMNIIDYKYYLELQMKNRSYVVKENNTSVRISDVLTSRFSHKPLKIFVGFNYENYPKFNQNYFYNSVDEEKHFGENRFFKRLLDDKLDFYTGMSHADEVYLTTPMSTVNGTEILPSPYASDLEKKFNVTVEEMEGYPPMSISEGVLEYAKWARKNGRTEDIERELGIEFRPNQEYVLKNEANLRFCMNFSKKPVSFYKFSSYSGCPLMFFFSYILKIPQKITYTFDLTPLEIGTIYHNVLKEVMQIGRDKLKQKSYNDVCSIVEKCVDEELKKITFFGEELSSINLSKISTVLVKYLFDVELRGDIDKLDGRKSLKKYFMYGNNKDDERFVPNKFEFSFSGEESEIDGIKFTGRVDRIDTCHSGLMIVDYKRKNNGEKEQLYLYASVIQKILKRPVVRAVFSEIENGNIANAKSNVEKIKDGATEMILKVKTFLENVKKGVFTPTKDACRACPYKKICPER